MRVHVFSIFFACFVCKVVALAINSNIAPNATSSTNSTKVTQYREMWFLFNRNDSNNFFSASRCHLLWIVVFWFNGFPHKSIRSSIRFIERLYGCAFRSVWESRGKRIELEFGFMSMRYLFLPILLRHFCLIFWYLFSSFSLSLTLFPLCVCVSIQMFFLILMKSENGGQNFFCQHGPAECTGNRLQSCVLDALNGDQDARAKFVTCQMKWNAEYTGRRVCMPNCHINFEWFLYSICSRYLNLI